jgi:hypothetical protein
MLLRALPALRSPGLARTTVAAMQMRGAGQGEPGERGAQVAAHAGIGGAQLADLAGVDVHVHDARIRRELGQLAGGAVVEAGADHDQQVAFLHRQIRRARAMHAEHAQVQRMLGRQRAQSLQGQHGRDLGGIDEGAEVLHRIAQRDAAAAIDHRPLRLRDQRQCLVQARRPSALHGIRRQRRMRRQVRRIGHLHVLRQVDQHRPGAAAARNAEGLGHHHRQVLDTAHDEAVLDHRQGHAEHVQFLERVGAHQVVRHLAGQHHHRHRIQHRIGDAGDQVGCARAGGRHAHADAPAGARITVRGERRALLVANQHVLQCGCRAGRRRRA